MTFNETTQTEEVLMTWGEFKAYVEAAGVTDEHKILFLSFDYSESGEPLIDMTHPDKTFSVE